MRWIDDVAAGLAALDLSRRKLRAFAWLVGGAALVAGLCLVARRPAPASGAALAVAGAALALAGVLAPDRLVPLYRAWMAVALALGWVVSRVLLVVLFFLVLAPMGLVGRALGKRFLALGRDPAAGSYWVRRPPGRSVDYRKMY